MSGEDTLDSLSKKIKTSKDVKKVVTTMKALAAANIRRYEKAVESLFEYRKNIEIGINSVVLNDKNLNIKNLDLLLSKTTGKDVIIALGSNQGLCGRFNDRVVDSVKESIGSSDYSADNTILLSFGDRLVMFLDGAGIVSNEENVMPNDVETMVESVYSLLSQLDKIMLEDGIRRIIVHYVDYQPGSIGSVINSCILPLNSSIIEDSKESHDNKVEVPMWRIGSDLLLRELLWHYLFTSVYYVLMTSLTSEQINRLITLQNAEKNIDEIMTETSLVYNQKRQGIITSELLDVVSGYKASKGKSSDVIEV